MKQRTPYLEVFIVLVVVILALVMCNAGGEPIDDWDEEYWKLHEDGDEWYLPYEDKVND